MFNEHVDTRISSLSYIKLKRLDNDIKKAFQKLVQIMKLKENQEKGWNTSGKSAGLSI